MVLIQTKLTFLSFHEKMFSLAITMLGVSPFDTRGRNFWHPKIAQERNCNTIIILAILRYLTSNKQFERICKMSQWNSKQKNVEMWFQEWLFNYHKMKTNRSDIMWLPCIKKHKCIWKIYRKVHQKLSMPLQSNFTESRSVL